MEEEPKIKKRFRVFETLLAVETLYLSIVLLLPEDTFGISIAYNAFLEVANETTWGVIIGFVFALQFGGMVLDNSSIKMIGLLSAAGLYFAMGTMFFIASYASTAWGTYFLLGVMAATLYNMVSKQRFGKRE